MSSILVVGAGPAGLTLAAVLHRAGVTPRLIDRATVPPDDRSRAIVIQARTLEHFDQLGIVGEVMAAGLATEQANLFLPSGRRGVIRIDPAWIESRYGRLQTLPQDETERILGELLTAGGVSIERGTELTGLTQDADAVHVELTRADGTVERATFDWVVGCDGAHSAVRHLSGLTFPGSTYDDECMLGDVDLDWGIPDGQVAICPTAEGFMLAFPLPGAHRFRVIMVLPAKHGADPEARALDHATFVEQLARMTPRFPERGGAPPVVVNARWLTRYRLHRRGVVSYRQGRCFVAGDAAHIHSPVGAQGMNTGIQDAFNLGWKLALVVQGHADAALLDTYHDERHRVGQYLLRNTDRMFAVVAGGGTIPRLLRRLAPAAGVRALSLPILGKRIARFVSQTAIRYRASALSTEGPTAGRLGRRAPRAGDRMPDVDLGAGGRLSEQLRAPGHLLLLFDGEAGGFMRLADLADEVAARYGTLVCPKIVVTQPTQHTRVLVDWTGEAHRRFGATKGGTYLIRPDGYIGWRDAACDAGELRRVLASRLHA